MYVRLKDTVCQDFLDCLCPAKYWQDCEHYSTISESLLILWPFGQNKTIVFIYVYETEIYI